MRRLLRDLLRLRERMLAVESATLRDFPEIHAGHVRGARNLAHYTALRACEARSLQTRLVRAGLSSLGRAEGNVLANLHAVIRLLALAAGTEAGDVRLARRPGAVRDDARPLERHAAALLGPRRRGRTDRILVTLPRESADDPDLVRGLVAAGMDCARVNCAHDDEDVWARMIRNVRRAAKARRRDVRVLMDLAGPKLRTGPIAPGPEVVRWRPRRDDLGRVVEPAHVLLVPAGAPPPAHDGVTLPVDAAWLARRRSGDEVSLVDARGSLRTLRLAAGSRRARVALASKSAWVVSGTRIEAAPRRGGDEPDVGTVGRLPPTEARLVLRAGDELILTGALEPGAPARCDLAGSVVSPARIACTLPEALRALRRGHGVWFDDGRIGGTVVAARPGEARVRIVHASPEGDRLRSDKGINLPDTPLPVAAMTEKDARDLRFVVAHADAVALSFVRCRADVEQVASRLAALGRPDLGLVVKVETREAFDRLPELLLAAMRMPSAGVMIARGDLAVECGWERLAEVQEEILWFCEAAHLPVIWATQVLDAMARSGRPTRAEVTDAAMSGRAECVMLNKGPHIRRAVAALDSILRRMEGHQHKKRPLLRRLHVAERFVRERRASGGPDCARRTDRSPPTPRVPRRRAAATAARPS